MVIFCFGAINKSWFWVCQKKHFEHFLVCYCISNCNFFFSELNVYIFINSKHNNELKKRWKKNHDLFISPKQKNTVLLKYRGLILRVTWPPSGSDDNNFAPYAQWVRTEKTKHTNLAGACFWSRDTFLWNYYFNELKIIHHV